MTLTIPCVMLILACTAIPMELQSSGEGLASVIDVVVSSLWPRRARQVSVPASATSCPIGTWTIPVTPPDSSTSSATSRGDQRNRPRMDRRVGPDGDRQNHIRLRGEFRFVTGLHNQIRSLGKTFYK